MNDEVETSDPFHGLDFDAVDWAGLTHAYGTAEDVPGLIRTLLSQDDEERDEALDGLISSINHQGSVYAASAPAIAFLARAALHAPHGRVMVCLFMSSMCREYGRDWSDPATFSGAVRVQLAKVLPELMPLLADPDAEIRRAMLRIVARCPSGLIRELVDLRTFDDEDDRVRADVLAALARLEPGWANLSARLESGLADSAPEVRQTAALALLTLHGPPYPRSMVATLARSVAAVGDVDVRFGSDQWDPLPGAAAGSAANQRSPKLGRHADGVLETLGHDADAALFAAGLIVEARTDHCELGKYTANAVTERWRGKQAAAASIIADYLSTASRILYPQSDLHRIGRCATEIGQPDPRLAAAVRPWTSHEEPAVADAAIGALARLREPDSLDLAERALRRAEWPTAVMKAVCEVFGERAAVLLPGIREHLGPPIGEPGSGSDSGSRRARRRRRRTGTSPAANPQNAAHAANVLHLLGPAALEAVPDLFALLDAGIAAEPVLRALRKLGPPVFDAAQGSDVEATLRKIVFEAKAPVVKIQAAAAHRAIIGDDSLAELVAAEIAEQAEWKRHTWAHLALLGAAAMACAPRVARDLAAKDAWTAVSAARTYWRITGDTARAAQILSQHIAAQPVGLAAIRTLLEMRHCPPSKIADLHYLAHAPQRLLHDGTQDGSRHADDTLREAARELLGHNSGEPA